MIRYALTAVFAVLLCNVTILAKDIIGTIKSVDNDKNTITITIKDKDTKESKDVTFKVAKDVKVTKFAKKDEAGEALENGLKNEQVTKGGSFARITTDNDDDSKANVTAVQVFAGGGFGGKDGGGKKGGGGDKKGGGFGKKGKDM